MSFDDADYEHRSSSCRQGEHRVVRARPGAKGKRISAVRITVKEIDPAAPGDHGNPKQPN